MKSKYFISFSLKKVDGSTEIKNSFVEETLINTIDDIRDIELSIKQDSNQLIELETEKIVSVTIVSLCKLY